MFFGARDPKFSDGGFISSNILIGLVWKGAWFLLF